MAVANSSLRELLGSRTARSASSRYDHIIVYQQDIEPRRFPHLPSSLRSVKAFNPRVGKNRAVRLAHKVTLLCCTHGRTDQNGGLIQRCFSVAVKLVPNSAAGSSHLVFLKLQHAQPTVSYHTQLLSALCTEFQLNQPATFLAAESDASTRQ